MKMDEMLYKYPSSEAMTICIFNSYLDLHVCCQKDECLTAASTKNPSIHHTSSNTTYTIETNALLIKVKKVFVLPDGKNKQLQNLLQTQNAIEKIYS